VKWDGSPQTVGSGRRDRGELGSVTVITAGILAIVGSVTFAVVKLGVAANDRARAQAVADLGALAGASVDVDQARKVVAGNGAVLGATESANAIDVSVSVGGALGEARAERVDVAWNPIDTGPGVTDDLETTTTTSTTTVPATTTSRALIFATIPAPTPTTRLLIFATIPPVTTKKPVAPVPPKPVPVPGTSPRR
jgi:uncharacterized membrane protein